MTKYRVPVLETFCWQEPVIRMDLNVAPGSGMAKGDRYIVASGASDDWAGHENDIAWWNGSAWEFDSPENGWKVFNNGFDGATNDDESFYRYDLTDLAWVKDQLAAFELGTPSDGSLSDGLLDFTTETPAVDAIDEINEVLKDVAPPDAESLAGKVLTDNVSWVSGKFPTGLDNDYYQGEIGGTAVGANNILVTKIIHQNNLRLQTPDTNKCFNKGDSGLLIVKHTDGETAEADVATLDIVANFVEPAPGSPREPTQTLTNWNETGDGDACTNGEVDFSNTTAVGNLKILSCGGYTGEDGLTPIFNMWQKMTAEINITTLQPGYNAFKLVHDLPADQESELYEVWYDNNTDALSFSVSPTIVFNAYHGTNVKYISGVRYYTDGDTFDVAFTGANLFKNCYRTDVVARYRFEACNADINIGPNPTHHVDDTFAVAETVTINRSNYYDLDARLTAYLFHPWKTLSGVQTSSENRMVCTYGSVSTDTYEYFRDENHRLLVEDYDTVPGNIIGQWTSANVLINGNALVYNQRVQYPNVNLTGSLPVGPNYSTGFTGDQVYCRAFYKNESNSGVGLTLNGINVNTDIGEVGSGNINVEVKLPGNSHWLDAGKDYNIVTFDPDVDGSGCKEVASTGSFLSITFGGRYTVDSGNMIIVKITFRNTTSSITSMNVDW